MNFKESNAIDITMLLKPGMSFYAHTNKGEKESLKEHTDLCIKYFHKIVAARSLCRIFSNIEKYILEDFSEEGKRLFRKLIINTISFHDIGKLNPIYQKDKMDNSIGDLEVFGRISSHHSMLSAVIYIDYFYNELSALRKEEQKLLSLFTFLNAYVISKHHGGLESFESFLAEFDIDNRGYNTILIMEKDKGGLYKKGVTLIADNLRKKSNIVRKTLGKVGEGSKGISLFIYEKLVFSLLVASDFYATTEFMKKITIDEFGTIDAIGEFYEVYKNTDIYKSIRAYEKKCYGKKNDLLKEKNINVLRTEMFLDAEKILMENEEEGIYYLEAPTGSGKSNVALNLSLKLLEKDRNLKKIYYVYPFNTLVEQNLKTLKNVFGNNKDVMNRISVVNSTVPISCKKEPSEDEGLPYDYYVKALLNRQFLNYPMILTTSVSLFNTMFEVNKESAFAFHQLANSVIVLDEIQSYKNNIWTEIILFLQGFSKLLNIRIIIMSATLPDLNILSKTQKNTCRLITDREKYFNNPLFKDRVRINYELLESQDTINDLYKSVKSKSSEGKKILVEFIKKASAYEFYQKIVDSGEFNCKVELITGDDTSIERDRILKKTEENGGIILIATQVIEAGVDIDMDIGYKDISKLDSEEQFLGRINRSCKKEGEVYFFDMDDCSVIYKNDIRKNQSLTLNNTAIREILLNKRFNDYYSMVMKSIQKTYNESFGDSNIDEFFQEVVGKLNFREISNRLKLIDQDNNISIFLSRRIKGPYGEIEGQELWNRYKSLLRDKSMDYAENKVKLSEILSQMNYFIYQIKKSNIIYNDHIGELYFIENGDDYFLNGKLNKNKLIGSVGDFI